MLFSEPLRETVKNGLFKKKEKINNANTNTHTQKKRKTNKQKKTD